MKKGFFNRQQTKSKSRPGGKRVSCATCGLYKFSLSPRMQAHGKGKKRILGVGEASGELEDRRGKQWQGEVGQFLRTFLKDKLGIDLFEDFRLINSCGCRPMENGKNREPTDMEINCCRPRVMKEIEEFQPDVIILFGGAAVKSVIGGRWKRNIGGIYKWRGWTIPDRDLNAWVCPVFHPSFVRRGYSSEKAANEAATIWKQDLERALNKLEEPFPEFWDERKDVQIIHDEEEAKKIIDHINLGTNNLLSFDYEVTGIKPHLPRHEILCMSLCVSPRENYVIPHPDKQNLVPKVRRLLANPYIGKTAHNIYFEDSWSEARIGANVRNWEWCSMNAAHVLDNRPKSKSLKFQTYVNFGICDYDSHINPYLETPDQEKKKRGANGFNWIWKFIEDYGWDELMLYCGLDGNLGLRLTLLQMEQLGYERESIQDPSPV